MTVRELAEFVLNHELDEVIEKCEEILNKEDEGLSAECVKAECKDFADGYYKGFLDGKEEANRW